MKVILLQDVAKIGRRFDITNVPDGYALNKLIPKAMAEPATPENIKRAQARASKTQADRDSVHATFMEAIASLADTPVTVAVEANEEGRMFQALKVSAVVEAVKVQGVTIQESQVVIKTPIKEVGEHKVELVSGDDHGSLTLSVIAK